MSVSKRLEEGRRHLGLSQAGLARLSGVPRWVINAIERGRLSRPYPAHAARLADALGVDVAALEAGGDDAGE